MRAVEGLRQNELGKFTEKFATSFSRSMIGLLRQGAPPIARGPHKELSVVVETLAAPATGIRRAHELRHPLAFGA